MGKDSKQFYLISIRTLAWRRDLTALREVAVEWRLKEHENGHGQQHHFFASSLIIRRLIFERKREILHLLISLSTAFWLGSRNATIFS
jgi:hypothetical protein